MKFPSWRLGIMDLEGPFGWCQPNIPGVNTLLEIRKKLGNFETMKWGDILNSGSHQISLEDFFKEARDRLRDIGQDDIDELFSLRLSGKERLLGILDAEVLWILWWDPLHLSHPSLKKHT